jgi:hypothetical protein
MHKGQIAALLFVLMIPVLAPAAPGFFSPQNASVPEDVKKASSSVFELRVIGARDQSLALEADVRGNKGSQVLADIRKKAKTGYFDDKDWIVIERQVKRCQRFTDQKAQEHCVILLDIRPGTGFVAKRGNVLWTAFHVANRFFETVQTFMNTPIEAQLESGGEVRLFVFNHQGQLVVDPYLELVKPIFWPKQTAVATISQKFYAQDSDVIGFELERKIAEPLKIGTAHLKETVFNIGFPSCTGCKNSNREEQDKDEYADRTPYPNAPGGTLMLSKGILLDGRLTLKALQADALSSLFDLEHMFFTSADAVGGSSGGPMLNAKGEVIGIVNSGNRVEIPDGPRLTIGARPPQFDLP